MRARHTLLPNLVLALSLSLGLAACGGDPSLERKAFDGEPLPTPTVAIDTTAPTTGEDSDVTGQAPAAEETDDLDVEGVDGGKGTRGSGAEPLPPDEKEAKGEGACAADDTGVCGPFSAELVAACLKFSTKDEAGRAACLSPRWSKAFHAQLSAHLAGAKGTEAASDAAFAKVMPHILHWEGGCSDHPADKGGRTYKGITAAVARSFGYRRDVCTLPDAIVMAIYRDRYWEERARHHAWPLNLAIMNTEVNSGGGRAAEFLERMKAQGVGGSLVEKAKWFVDQQTAYYRAIVANNASQKVFLAGWLNRSAYMRKVVSGEMAGEPSFALLSGEGAEVVPSTPKAY